MADTFQIMTVCTGNICRSPAAERLLAAGLGHEVQVSSMGTSAVVGAPIEPQMVAMLDPDRISSAGFAARQFTESELRQSNLVLAMTQAHRARLVEDVPAILRRSFTLLEFARIVSSPELPRVQAVGVAERLRELVPLASQYRQLGEVLEDDDIPDPYRLDDSEFERSYRLIREAVDKIVAAAKS